MEEQKYVLTVQQLQQVVNSLNEMPAKFSFATLLMLDGLIKSQEIKKEENK